MWIDMFLAIVFASGELGIEPPENVHPVVLVQEHCALQKSMALLCNHGPRVDAYYIPGSNTIVMSDRLRPGSHAYEQVLVHEVTHWLQDRQGRMTNITPQKNCELEKEAYNVAYKWLEITQTDDPLSVMGFSPEDWNDLQACSSYATEIKKVNVPH